MANSLQADRALAQLAEWRECGADRVDPARFRRMQAMARRASGYGGEARRILDDRLGALLQDYEAVIRRLECKSEMSDNVSVSPHSGGRLAGLVEYIAARSAASDRAAAENPDKQRRESYPELELLDYFRDTWLRVGADRQLRQSQEQVPDNAGPLNSSHLAHRALTLMRDVSPAYLRHFLSYVDALSWMEQISNGMPAGKDSLRAAGARKGRAGKRGAR